MSIQLTQAERGAYGHFFALADPQSTGVVSGNSAVSFFALSGLPSPVLGSIWTLADKDNNGFLTPAHFSVALRLIGHAQNGKVVTEELISQPSPLPTFKGVVLPPHLSGAGAGAGAGAASATAGIASPSRSSSQVIQPQLTGQLTGPSMPSTPGAGAGGAIDIRPEDRARYTRIFAGAGPQGGLLDGEKAKEIFVKSKLPFDKLGAIWNLADTKARGKLDLTDFIVGMHFIQSTMNGSLTSIPATLPAGLYEKAAGVGTGVGARSGSPIPSQITGGSIGGSNFIQRQMTGQSAPTSPVPSTIRSPSMLQPQRTGAFANTNTSFSTPSWAVLPADKTKSDQFFDGLDQEKKGILEGQAAVPFFMQSGLNEATLAHVWDLSDITQSGTLTRDEFAVAMHLINTKLAGGELPQELPANLIPPSLRNQQLPQAVNPQETDTQRDLFSLMDDDVDLPVSATSAFVKPAIPPPSGPTASSKGAAFDNAFDDDFDATQGNAFTAAPVTTSPLPRSAAISPTPTGASASTATGLANRSAFAPFAQPSIAEDSSIDAQNQRLALESTQKSLSTLEQTKTDLSRNVSADAHTIDDIKTRLETVRMRHQTESEAVRALQERHAAQTVELKKLREESVREESELSRLKNDKDEIEQALMKDREDVREMKRLVGEKTKERETLVAEIEKLKKEARQQKGLLAIGKKQLTQSENDAAKAQEDLTAVKAGHADVAEEGISAQQEHAAHGEVPVTSSPEVNAASSVKSPAASVRSTNPFDRNPPQAAQATASPKTSALAIGGTVGALATAGAGAAALAHHETQDTSAAAPSADDEQADPFGLATQPKNETFDPIAAAPAAGSTQGFDDNFGKDADTVAVIPPDGPPVTNVNQSFNDAFADLDDSAQAPAGEAEKTNLQTAEHTSSPFGQPSTLTAEPEELRTSAPTVAQVASNADTEPGFTSDDKAKATQVPLGNAEEEAEESSDDDEGPEDIEGNIRHYTGSPDELGKGKSPLAADVLDDGTTPGVSAAADRFPVVDDESPTSKAPIPVSAASFGAPIADPMLASTTAATEHAGFATPQATGSEAGDAFHDASDHVGRSDSAPTSAVDAVEATTSSAFLPPAHERFTTAVEGDTAQAATRDLSPAKARRAPPAIPMRSGTGASPFEAPAAAGEAKPTLTSTAANTASPMDDFDAAFEDLGPAAEGAGAGAGAAREGVGNVTSTSGFDDTFGDADGFDFVPSFSTNDVAAAADASSGTASKSVAPATSSTGTKNGVTVLGNNFDGFDSAFDSAFDTTGAGAAASKSQTRSTDSAATGGAAAQSTSNTGSGFSFEDAFAPAESTTNSTALPDPAAPIRGSSSQAPAAAPAAPPRPSAGGAGTGALADDAGPVKQLCSMGFTRDNVIKALERSNYRTDKALERLLAS